MTNTRVLGSEFLIEWKLINVRFPFLKRKEIGFDVMLKRKLVGREGKLASYTGGTLE